MIDILHFFRTVMVTPKPFGAWHLTSVFLVVATIALLVWRFRRADEKTVRIILLCAWVLMVLGEVYKQITFTYNFAPDGTVIKDYMWHVFPYQFCSTPLYVLPFATCNCAVTFCMSPQEHSFQWLSASNFTVSWL